MKKQVTLVLAIVVLILLGLSFWYLQSGVVTYPTTTTTMTTETTTQTPATTTLTTTPTSTLKEFTVIAKQWQWDITDSSGNTFVNQIGGINKGDRVRLKIKSIDVTHGFSLPDFNINQQLSPNQEVTIEFVADKSGTFGFACSVFCGAGHGTMRGNLVVS